MTKEVYKSCSFVYLGSCITTDCKIREEISSRIGKAAKASGCLQNSIFFNNQLSIDTKWSVYRAVVLPILLYGSETWTVKSDNLRHLQTFHNQCVRSIMGITKYQQWQDKIPSQELAKDFGMEELISDVLTNHRLRWLGHVTRMDDKRLPKQMLFGELASKRPCHGAKKRWRDAVSCDMNLRCIPEKDWYTLSQERTIWKSQINRDRTSSSTSGEERPSTEKYYQFHCQCRRSFLEERRPHKTFSFCKHISSSS